MYAKVPQKEYFLVGLVIIINDITKPKIKENNCLKKY